MKIQVVVGLPDVRGREQILKVHMRRVPLAPDIDAAIIARGTPGFSGADLANLVNEAALFAARGNFLRFRHHHGATFRTHHDFVFRFLELNHRHNAFVTAGSKQRRFVDQVGQIRTGEARGTPGFSGADLANLVNEAALFAARGNKRVVSMVEFEKAKDKIMMGAERRSMVMTEAQKVTAGSKQRRFVDQVGQIRTGEARGTARNDCRIDIRRQRNATHMHFQDLLTTANIRQANHHLDLHR